MAEYTRPATWDDVQRVALLLDEAGVRYALIGGYALAAHGLVRFSEDIDLLVDPSPDNTHRWIDALSKLPDGAARELASDAALLDPARPYPVRINDEFTVDVMPAACGHSWQELSAYIEQIAVEGRPLKVLSLQGLLLTKEGMRDRDRADAAAIRSALEGLTNRG